MWASSIVINNVKSFADSGVINLDKRINILIGPNNSGKSVIINALYLLQNQSVLTGGDIRKGASEGKVILGLEDFNEERYITAYHQHNGYIPKVHFVLGTNGISNMIVINPQGGSAGAGALSKTEPDNFIYPFLAKRKVVGYTTSVNSDIQNAIVENFQYLPAKISRISDQHYELNAEYEAACKGIIGFSLSTVAIPNGQIVGTPVGKHGSIPITAMGEGIPHLLALINDLCLADNKLFLIEEPENDIHPKALKHLLDLIIKKCDTNQFVISTHSHIVMQYLGSVEKSKIHYISRDEEQRIPTANYREVGDDPEERIAILEDLGYEMTDLYAWKGWLILEEASAERIINDFLIPQFAPRLKGYLRTIAARGIDKVPVKFEDFNKLFLYAHLARTYRNKAWVVVDNGKRGHEVIKALKEKYIKGKPDSWREEQFHIFSKDDFEEYYPEAFQDKAKHILQKPDGQHKQAEKTALLSEVLKYIQEDQQRARDEFEQSAGEVILLLRSIEIILCPS